MDFKTQSFNPILLTAKFFEGYQIKGDRKMEERIVYDYEVEYYTKSQGGVWIDGEYITYENGDIGIRKPGQKVCGILPYNCYLMVIDLNGNYAKKEGYKLGCEKEKQPRYNNPILEQLPHKIVANQSKTIEEIIKKIYKSHLCRTELEEIEIKINLFLLIKALYEAIKFERPNEASTHPAIRESIQYMTEHFTEDVVIGELIKESKLSKAYFHRLFQKDTGCTPNQFLTKLRIEKAKTLLILSQEEIAEIAYQCGYYDPAYFTYLFKKATGVTPTEFKKKN